MITAETFILHGVWSKNSAQPQVALNQRLGIGWKHSFSIVIDSGLKIPDAVIFQEPASGVVMKFLLQPWQILLLILAGWINKQRQNAVNYLIMENRILRERRGRKRILLTDDQRRRLAIKGKILGRKALGDLCTMVTPETILRWHRNLVAQEWDYSKCRKKLGRPRTDKEIVELLVQMARENPAWAIIAFRGQ